jgi:hypothetical protein
MVCEWSYSPQIIDGMVVLHAVTVLVAARFIT